MITAKIPDSFISKRTVLNWNEVKFGLEHQLIAPGVAINKATENLSREGAASNDEIELASSSENEPVSDLVTRLADAETPPTAEHLKAKWLYLMLAWLFENRESVSEPLAVIEEVYSDFDYPQAMASFVRYMPMQGSDLRSEEQNEARLFDNWKAYLDHESRRFG